MKIKKYSSAIAVAFVGIFSIPAKAHLRNYLDTYGYYTLEKGHAEAELWTDRRNPDSGKDFWRHQTEVEYGVTDRWSLGLYGVFIENKGFSAFKIENRYRLPRRGAWPFDTALYFEIKDANGRKEEDELEGKLIISKEMGGWNFSANGILGFEREIEPGGEAEWEMGPAVSLGAAYKTGGRVTPGIEFFSAKHKTRLVPGLYIDLMPEVRLNIGAGIGLESQADNFQLKSILEVEF